MATAALGILGAVDALLHAVNDPTPHSARETLSNCYCAVADMITSIADPPPDDDAEDEGYDAEQAWQLRVIERIAQNAARPMSRALVADLVATPLAWRTHLDAYTAAVR